MTAPVARTVKDFCRAYGIGKTLAYELIGAGSLKAVKVGTRTLIPEDSAQAWFNSLPCTTEKVSALTHAFTHAGDADFDELKRTTAKHKKRKKEKFQ